MKICKVDSSYPDYIEIFPLVWHHVVIKVFQLLALIVFHGNVKSKKRMMLSLFMCLDVNFYHMSFFHLPAFSAF